MTPKIEGPVQGTPLVFIHAFPVNERMWDEQVNFFKPCYRVMTYSQRGFGKSNTHASAFTMEHLVDDLISALDHCNVKEAVVVGLSLGGYVALRAIERNPDRFKGLVLADTQSAADSNEAKIKRYQAMRAIQENGLKEFAKSFLKNALSEKTRSEKPAVAESLARMIEENSPEGVIQAVLALVSRTDTTEALSTIKVPTLIVVGEKDTVTPLKAALDMQSRIAGAKLHVVPEAGHFSNLENATDFNAAVKDFLDSL